VSDLQTIAGRIKLTRKNLGMTKRELAEKMGLHETSIAKYELGKVDFPVSRIRELAEILGVTESWLLGLGVFQCKVS
jgi:transcriptional regulator with XRE-family HTH domain